MLPALPLCLNNIDRRFPSQFGRHSYRKVFSNLSGQTEKFPTLLSAQHSAQPVWVLRKCLLSEEMKARGGRPKMCKFRAQVLRLPLSKEMNFSESCMLISNMCVCVYLYINIKNSIYFLELSENK